MDRLTGTGPACYGADGIPDELVDPQVHQYQVGSREQAAFAGTFIRPDPECTVELIVPGIYQYGIGLVFHDFPGIIQQGCAVDGRDGRVDYLDMPVGICILQPPVQDAGKHQVILVGETDDRGAER